VNRIAARLGIEWIDAAVEGSATRLYGTVTWLRPDRDDLACFACRYDADALAAVARTVRREPCASWRNPATADTPSTLMASPFGAVVAGWQATWAIEALVNDGPPRAGHQLQISGSGEPRMRTVELARRPSCAAPHRALAPLERAECRTVGELVDRAQQDLGCAPDALVLPDRPLALGLRCAECGRATDLTRRCEAIRDDEVRCGCGAASEMGPIEVSNRLDAARLRALAGKPWADLGIPAEDLITAVCGERQIHYLLPRAERREAP
jgi:hypothetical protein